MSMAQMGQATMMDDNLRQKLSLTMPKARVTQVIDGQTFIVNNTTTIHLPALYIPRENDLSQGEYGARAKNHLESMINEKFVRIYQVRNNERALTNAIGHQEGYVTLEDGTLLQQALIEKGFAFAYPTQSHFVIADVLYSAENKAREEKIGFWGDDEWSILTADNTNDIENRFAIIEGTVKKVASRNNVIYLNFGDDWKSDFTVSMASDLRRDFSKMGLNVMQMAGQKIRARGWVRYYKGTFMEIFHPSQIEFLAPTAD